MPHGSAPPLYPHRLLAKYVSVRSDLLPPSLPFCVQSKASHFFDAKCSAPVVVCFHPSVSDRASRCYCPAPPAPVVDAGCAYPAVPHRNTASTPASVGYFVTIAGGSTTGGALSSPSVAMTSGRSSTNNSIDGIQPYQGTREASYGGSRAEAIAAARQRQTTSSSLLDISAVSQGTFCSLLLLRIISTIGACGVYVCR